MNVREYDMPRGRKKKTEDKDIIDESQLTKGHIRKLNALRKSIGDEIGEKAFVAWLATSHELHNSSDEDHNVVLIGDTLNEVRDRLKFPRGGAYLVRQGRGRVIVEPAHVE